MARLLISAPDGKRGIYEISKPIITVGRGVANDLVLNDASVSRLHAVVKQGADGKILIADRGSTNGVRLNGARIENETPIQSGDVVYIGLYEVQFESVDDIAFDVHEAALPLQLQKLQSGDAAELADSAARVLQLERENYLLRLLYDAGTVLHGKHSRNEVVEELVSLAFRIEGVERGFCLLLNERGELHSQTEVRYRKQRLKPRTSSALPPPPINLSRSIMQRIKSERVPVLIHDLPSDRRFQNESALRAGVRSAMCAPLLCKSRLFGIMYVDNLQKSDAFTQEELNVFALLASQAAVALDGIHGREALAEQFAQRAALERFLSPEVVEMVANNPNLSLGGANQKVSILFADIRNFTGISETMPPERLVEMLNEYFSRVTDVIFDHGGTLDKFLGDGVMAFFGAPISKGNDAANAVRAAIEIQRLVVHLNQDAAARKRPAIQVGIGINTGIVTAGNIGSLKRLDYTVIGDAVNVAARLMSAAAGGQILISDSTAVDLDEGFKLGGRKPVLLKGKSSPFPVLSVRWLESKAAGKH